MLGVGSRSRRKRQLYTTEARLDKVNITGTWGHITAQGLASFSQMTANVEMSPAHSLGPELDFV